MKHIFVLVVLSLMPFLHLQPQILHTLIIARDRGIQIPIGKDAMVMEALCSEVAASLNMPLEVTCINIDDAMANVVAFERKIDDLSYAKEDIVVVYYSGYGGRSRQDKTNSPQIILNVRPIISLSSATLAQKLLDKRARFYLMLFDCNNSYIEGLPVQENVSLIYKSNSEKSEKIIANDAIGELFANEGYVIISSAKAGNCAYVTPEGSIFLQAFSALFQDGKVLTSWETFLSSLSVPSGLTNELTQPDYSIFIK